MSEDGASSDSGLKSSSVPSSSSPLPPPLPPPLGRRRLRPTTPDPLCPDPPCPDPLGRPRPLGRGAGSVWP
eukprot:3870553-Rhodomonas_salina.1